MKLLAVGLPALILVNGIVLFFLLRLDLQTRILILLSEIVAAGIVGFVLWRRSWGR